MKMPADGPTIDEVSPMDTTSSSSDIDELRPESVGGRPVKRTVAMQNWLLENLKGIIVGVISTLFAGFCVRIAITHSEKLAAHEKDIEHLEETISNHDDKIERLQEGTNTLNTDLRLLEQRVDLTKDSGKPTKKQHVEQSSIQNALGTRRMVAWLYGKVTIQYFSNMPDNSFVNQGLSENVQKVSDFPNELIDKVIEIW